MPEKVSAQVILRPADVSGPGRTGHAADRSGAVPPALPTRMDEVRMWFGTRGFETSGAFAGSFSIIAPPERFDSLLGTDLAASRGPHREATRGSGLALPLDRLPPRIAGALEQIVIGPSPDFGPTGFDGEGFPF